MTKQTSPQISVVVPAFNEAERLAENLQRIAAYLESRKDRFEILVVDDGSWDQTFQIAENLSSRGVRAFRLQQNQGKGAALRHGVLRSLGEKILITDADLSTPIEDLERLEPFLTQAPAVIGSRALKTSKILQRQPLYRVMMGRIFNRLVRLLAVDGIRDTQCGFKLFNGRFARSLFAEMVSNGFSFDVEILWLARRRGAKIEEAPVSWRNEPRSTVRPLVDPLWMLIEILQFRVHHACRPQFGAAALSRTPSSLL